MSERSNIVFFKAKEDFVNIKNTVKKIFNLMGLEIKKIELQKVSRLPKRYKTYNIEGFVYNTDLFFLIELLKDKIETKNPSIVADCMRVTFIEFGCYYGRSFLNTVANVANLKSLQVKILNAIAVDPFPGLPAAKESFPKNLDRINKIIDNPSNIFIRHYESKELIPAGQSAFDIVHIDSAHTEVELEKDFEFSLSRLCAGGVIICDDVWSDIFPGVTSGVFKMIHRHALSVLLVTSAKIYICRESDHEFLSRKVAGFLQGIECDFYFNFASDDYSQENDIKGMKVISLKRLQGNNLINQEQLINQLFDSADLWGERA